MMHALLNYLLILVGIVVCGAGGLAIAARIRWPKSWDQS